MAELPTDDAPDWTQGFYEIEYIKENGQWKISSLKWAVRLISPMTQNKIYKIEEESIIKIEELEKESNPWKILLHDILICLLFNN
jgi:hypothetical protein